MPVSILSIQSWVAYGHVGNASAVFPLQRLGAEVWAVNTVQFSNHTGYGAWRGEVFSDALIRDCVAGIADRGVLAQCDAVLSGYMGSPAIGAAIGDAVAMVKAANPRAIWCCDPVLGDTGRGIYVRPGIPEFLRDHALPAADLATPNQFELEWLTGMPVATLDDAKAALMALSARGPRRLLLTSLRTEDTPEDAMDMLAMEGGAFHRLRTPRLPVDVNGAGDAIAALFLFHTLAGRDAGEAMALSGAALHGILAATAAAGARELQTIAAQQELLTPSVVFPALPC